MKLQIIGLMLPSFATMDPGIKALVIVIGGTLLTMAIIRFIQRVGVVIVLVPTLVVAALLFTDKAKTALQQLP